MKGLIVRIRVCLVWILVVVILTGGGCSVAEGNSSSNFEKKFDTLVQPYAFNLAGWEVSSLYNDTKQKVFHPESEDNLNSQTVIRYFSYIAQLNTLKSDLQMVQAQKIQFDINQHETQIIQIKKQINDLKPAVEQTIGKQISSTLAEQGIYAPFGDGWFKLTFPPVNFMLERPLYMLIISPRDKIEQIRSITIQPDITTDQMEELESSLDQLNISALVVPIGGLGATYPAFVIDDADLRFTINAASEEWLHQYLTFKPLGFRYVLDLLEISESPDIPTVNETVVGIASQELGTLVYDKYYAQYQTEVEEEPAKASASAVEFDFNAAMREIRKTVDQYLAQGQVDQAEKYMEEQRQFLITKGYYIRKLNQAYFAFYGSYAYSETSIDPIGNETRVLRQNSLSLKDFLDKASRLTNSKELHNLVSGN